MKELCSEYNCILSKLERGNKLTNQDKDCLYICRGLRKDLGCYVSNEEFESNKLLIHKIYARDIKTKLNLL